MAEPFVGSEALAAGTLTKSQLCTRYRRLFRDVYVHRDIEVTATLRAKAGWLWAGRRGVIAGFSAAAMHGSGWVDDSRAVELIHDNRHRMPGIQTRVIGSRTTRSILLRALQSPRPPGLRSTWAAGTQR
jgi:hypothetical protein